MMKKMRCVFATTVFVAILLVVPAALASEEASQERVDLFLASQNMLIEEKTPPRMKVGMILSTLGGDDEISMGVRVESRLGNQENVKIITETAHLKAEETLAGFLSVKITPFGEEPVAMYLGGGAGWADGFRFQAFAGVDLTKNLFAEVRYVNMSGGFANTGLYLATGFQFTF